MTDDDGDGAGIPEHFGRQIAGEGPGRLGVAILAADLDRLPCDGSRKTRKQGRRRAHHHIDPREGPRTANDFGNFGRRSGGAVHLPIARHDRAARPAGHVRFPAFSRIQLVSRAVESTPEPAL